MVKIKIKAHRGELLDLGLLIGKEYEIATPQARALIDCGWAEEVRAPEPEPEPEPVMAMEVEEQPAQYERTRRKANARRRGEAA